MSATWDIFVKDLYERYYLQICEFARRLVGCREAARDLAQDAFVVLLENQSVVSDNPTVIRSYLYSTVKNAALNRFRHQQIASRIHSRLVLDDTDELNVLQAMVHAEILGELNNALDSLPKGCGSICKMAFIEGKKNQEIADALGVSINTIKTQKQRAIFLLRGKLSPDSLMLLLACLLN